jgi:hypothetical protein
MNAPVVHFPAFIPSLLTSIESLCLKTIVSGYSVSHLSASSQADTLSFSDKKFGLKSAS